MKTINIIPNKLILKPSNTNEVAIAKARYKSIFVLFSSLSNLWELKEVNPAEKFSPAQSIPK